MSSVSMSGGKRGRDETEPSSTKRPKLKTEVAETLGRYSDKFGVCPFPPIPVSQDAVKELAEIKTCVTLHMQVASEGFASLKTAQFDLSSALGAANFLRSRSLECTAVTAATTAQGARPARAYFVNVAPSSRTFGDIAKGWNVLTREVAFRLLTMDPSAMSPAPFHLSIDACPPFITQKKLAPALALLGLTIAECSLEGDEDFGAVVDPLRLEVTIETTCKAEVVEKIKSRKLALPLVVLGVPLKLESGKICSYCGDETHSKKLCPIRAKLSAQRKEAPPAAPAPAVETVKVGLTAAPDAQTHEPSAGPAAETGAQKGAYPRANTARSQQQGRGGGQWRGGRSQSYKPRGSAWGN